MSDPLQDLLRLEGVPSALEAARSAADVVLRDRGLRRIGPDDVARALLLGAGGSAAMAAEDLLAPGEDPGLDWHPGAVRLSTQLPELAALVGSAPGQLLTRCHTVLARGLLPDEALGRVRSEPGVGERVLELTRLLHRPSTVPALLRAAVAHGEVAALRPFEAGNGLVARALEHLVLVHHGVDPRAALVPEVGHRESGPAYRAALEGYATGTAQGVRTWVRHCADALAVGAERSPLAAGRH